MHVYEPDERVDHVRYIELLDEVALPACEQVYPDGNFVYQQDGAPAHKHKETQRFLEEHAPQFIRGEEWPAYSCDLSPSDYRLHGWWKQKVYARGPARDLEELKTFIREAWEELDTETIRGWLRELRPRLQKVIEENGRPIQQYFNKI